MRTIVLATALCACVTGCYSSTEARKQAKELADQIATYREDQKQRITRINDEYRDDFTRLMDSLSDLAKVELQQDRNVDAQRIADDILGDHDNFTRRGEFRQAFADAVRGQRERIAQADLAVAQAKNAYLQAYREAALELAHIDRTEARLRELAGDEDRRQTFEDFVRTVVKIHEDIKKKAAEKSAAKTPDNGTGGGSK
jgi:capsule polysaccharide export protein KpsE/RkpR